MDLIDYQTISFFINCQIYLRDHQFSILAKYSEKLIFLIPLDTHKYVYVSGGKKYASVLHE